MRCLTRHINDKRKQLVDSEAHSSDSEPINFHSSDFPLPNNEASGDDDAGSSGDRNELICRVQNEPNFNYEQQIVMFLLSLRHRHEVSKKDASAISHELPELLSLSSVELSDRL